MSLINDALKRVSRLHRKPLDPSGAPPPLPPLEPVPSGGKKSRVGVLILLVVVLAGAAWAVVTFWPKGPVEAQGKAKTVARTNATESSTGAVASAVAPAAGSNSVAQTESAAPVKDATAPASDVATEQPAAPTAAPAAPGNEPAAVANQTEAAAAMKLQGIVYRSNKPMALISGRMVGLGDSVNGARVVAINSRSVTVEQSGQTNVLSLRH